MSLVRKYKITLLTGIINNTFTEYENYIKNLNSIKGIYESNGISQEYLELNDDIDNIFGYYYFSDNTLYIKNPLFDYEDPNEKEKDEMIFYGYLYSKFFNVPVNTVEW